VAHSAPEVLELRLLVISGVLVLAASAVSAQQGGASAPAKRDAVARGGYLVTVTGCHDCHTPKKMGPHGPEPDMSRALSGHPETAVMSKPPALSGGWMAATSADLTAWAGPWGVSYAFNLTPDENTGLGIWTEEMFVKAMRTGRHMGASRPILPPMPWQNFARLSDADLSAMYAYLRSIPAVKNRVPEAVIVEPPAPAASR
jgi:mono/diheme cytochrome c family protein